MSERPVRAAATAIVARDGADGIEVYMVRRSARAAFVPDAFVFPGGALDPEDAAPENAALLDGTVPGVEPEFTICAVRETFEEVGLLLGTDGIEPRRLAEARAALLGGGAAFGAVVRALEVRIDARALRYYSRWITPAVEPRRFDARFFIARAPHEQVAEADAQETHDGRWLRPADALAAHAAGSFAMIYPTVKHLMRLAAFATVDDLFAHAAERTVVAVSPAAIPIDGGYDFALAPELDETW